MSEGLAFKMDHCLSDVVKFLFLSSTLYHAVNVSRKVLMLLIVELFGKLL